MRQSPTCGMVEWKQLPQSIRLTTERFEADVWPFITTKKVYKWTVIDRSNGQYLDCGMAGTQDLACERAIKAMEEWQ